MEDLRPYQRLPIKRPLEDENPPSEVDFYQIMVQKFIPDILSLQDNGIPIDLNKVKELEEVVDNVLTNVRNKLSTNTLMLDFLSFKNNIAVKNKQDAIKNKLKTKEDFIKPFDINNKAHRSAVLNAYLTEIGKEDMILPEWSIKDMRKLDSVIASLFVQNLLAKVITSQMQKYIDLGMDRLAQEKADIFNKNKQSKMQEVESQDLIGAFNPASSLQKQQFFEAIGVESERTTKGGKPKWDRDELEKLQKLLKTMLEKVE